MKRPNILFILTDQHRLSAVGAYGPTPCRTPRIDELARDGVLFENAYTTCPVCSPARATIMTGQYPHTHGITGNIHDISCAVHELQDRPGLLSRRLQAAGYSLGYTGKWHLGTDTTAAFGATNTPVLPRDVGFEGQNFPGHGNGGHGFAEYREYLERGGWQHRVKPWSEKSPNIWFSGELEGPAESTVEHFLADHTISLMERFRTKGRPFFIWHNFWGPHIPYWVPGEYLELYRNVEIPPWQNYGWPSRQIPGPHHVVIHPDHERLQWNDWATTIRYYYAFATLIDAEIGRMIDHLRTSGLLEDTVIVFSADHGETLGSHGGLTDKGWHHFEETHRIPMIIRMPGVSPRRVDRLVSLLDIYPTLLDLAGSQWDRQAVQGESLRPLLSGTPGTWRDSVVTEFCSLNNLAMTMRTLRVGHMKYGFSSGARDELYDLGRDPHETLNLIDNPEYRVSADELRARLADWMKETGDPASWWYRRMNGYYQTM
jgi:arylsulfatase A-like enzyme